MKLKIVTVTIALLGLAACQSTSIPIASDVKENDSARPRAATSKTEATGAAVSKNIIALNKSRKAVSDYWANKSFEEFERTVSKEQGTGYYIVNGDILISDRKQLEAFFDNEVKAADGFSAQLIMHKPGGVLAKWSDTAKRNLTYCISNAFGSRKSRVIADMAAAGNAWAQQGDVSFIHSSAQDNNCNAFNNQVVFDVRPVSDGDYLARAFFPNDPRGRRNVLIDDSSFNPSSSNLTLRGVLRHELGHVLGFRHEHTRPESGACFEDNDWEPLTSYDAFSVMHYPQCNGQGDWSLNLTANDKNGICKAYGQGPAFNGSDPSVCANATPVPSPGPISTTCRQEVASTSGNIPKGQQTTAISFDVQRGGKFRVEMTGSGDPDLHVRFNSAPTLSDYDCRPYLSGPNEVCEIPVPNDTKAFVMVNGYAAGTYQLEIEIDAP